MKRDLKVEIMELLLTAKEDMWLSEMSRKLKRPSSLIYYHLKTLVEKGILIRVIDERMVKYYPNVFFEEDNIKEVRKLLKHLYEAGVSQETIANCLKMYLDL